MSTTPEATDIVTDRFLCTKLSTKDNRDGLSILSFKAEPKDFPAEIKHGIHGDRYDISIVHDEQTHRFEAIRFTLDDDGKGSVILRLGVLPGQVGDAILYAPKDTPLAVTYSVKLTGSDIMPFKPETRQATLRKLHVIMSEPAFWDFLVRYDAWALLSADIDTLSGRQDAALEVLYRHVKCHSRSDIVSTAAICEKVERLIREYRREQWNAPTERAGRSNG